MLERLASKIHDAALTPERWPTALAAASEALGGAAVLLIHGEAARFHAGEAWTANYDTSVYRSFPIDGWALDANPGFAAVCSSPVGTVNDRRRYLPVESPHHDPAFRHFVVDQGLDHALMLTAQRDATVVSPTVVARARGAPEFDRDEVRKLEAIGRHIGQAMRTHRALRRLEHRAASLAVILDRLYQGAILTDGGLRVLYANAAAAGILEAGDGLRLRYGRLRPVGEAAGRGLAAAVRRVSGRTPELIETRLLLPRLSGALPYTLTVLPALGDSTSALAPRARTLVLVDDPEAGLAPLTPERLADVFSLRAAEARIAVLAAQALPVAEIADRSGRSANTVKTHLKAIYAKLDVRSQAELVRSVMARTRG
jgi:DNA-binding CsgD family transcriptional regulator/PAS domain-containing protein